MTDNENHGLGRIQVIDDRDKNFPVANVINNIEGKIPNIPKKFWWADGWWGDQGTTPHCVAFSWMHFLEDGPVIQDGIHEGRSKPFYNASSFYDLCQNHDQWPGTNYDGTSVRAGAKILKHIGVIDSYHWAFSIDDVIKALKYIGPMVVGTRWYSGMTNPSNSGVVKPQGRDEGGHAYIINGVDEDIGVLRIKNSWGRRWGKNGYAYIDLRDFSELLSDGGEACIAFEKKMVEIPMLIFS